MARTLHALSCMEHRGGCGGDRVSGDGAGVLTAIPWELFEAQGHLKEKPPSNIGVAMTFLPQDEAGALEAQEILAKNVRSRRARHCHASRVRPRPLAPIAPSWHAARTGHKGGHSAHSACRAGVLPSAALVRAAFPGCCSP
eukprot:3898894-Prymnesium_polylepis.1